MKDFRKYFAEFIGTFVLVVFGCGVAAVLGCATPAGYVGTALAFGLVIVAMAYSIGNISGCHINPAVSFAMWLGKKISLKDLIFYVLSQVLGAFAGALLVALFSGSLVAVGANAVQPGTVNTYGNVASLFVGLGMEAVLTFVFILAILGVTSRAENKGVVGLVIGLSLTLVHLLGIGLTGTSVNPARSFGPALVAAIGGDFTSLSQIWIFIVGPLAGAALAFVVYSLLDKRAAPRNSRKHSELKRDFAGLNSQLSLFYK
jgi:aquaporin Z